MLLKVCGLTETQEMSALDNMGVDFIGMIFYKSSPRYLNKHLDLMTQSNAKRVGVFVNENQSIILETVKLYNLDYVQLHGDESPDYCANLHQKGMSIIKAFRIGPQFQFSIVHHYEKFCSYFLFDTQSKLYGGSGKSFNWNLLKQNTSNRPYFLSGGIDDSDVEKIKSALTNLPNCVGVDINSRFEISPGKKDITKIETFIKNLCHHE